MHGIPSIGVNMHIEGTEEWEDEQADIVSGKRIDVDYYVGIRWREGGEPEILGTSVSDLSEIKFTEKGYFIYTFENPVAHAGLREYWRVSYFQKNAENLQKNI